MRTIREDDAYREMAAAIEPDARRFDDIQDAVKWAIAINAEGIGTPVEGTILKVLVTTSWFLPQGIPSLWFYFSIDDEHTCTLRAVRTAPEETDEITG
jgi:hypothetical protein